MHELLAVEGKLYPSSSKTHITYQFHIPTPLPSLQIDFQYAPKKSEDKSGSRRLIEQSIEQYVHPSMQAAYMDKWEQYMPLQNLLTISVDDPSEFRGSAHRHPEKQSYLLATSSASPGFIPGAILEGIWRITISVHCVVTPDCNYLLRVTEGEQHL
ncbi:hypothetical protein [Paenibacillus pinihumi]|uniref:hypothetical protein n=1 Tax=Paenibacillus pinihumi TaxID=669462 RepID=UPI0004906B7A|nr:hypothetical protein [Paenibacillus pinihumi]